MVPYNYDYDVFLSYASQDRGWATRLAERLRDDGFQVFFDQWSIGIGENILHKIKDALRSSYKTVFVMTPDYFTKNKEWVEFELITSQADDLTGKKRKLLPLLLKLCDIPADVKGIKHINFTIEEEFEENYHILVKAIKDVQAMQIGPREMFKPQDRDNFIDRAVKKIGLFFGYPKPRLHLLRYTYDELTENAFHWGSRGRPIIANLFIDDEEICLEVRDSGEGFDLIQEIKNAKEFIRKNPSFKRKRGLLGVFTNCDQLYNGPMEGMHAITAIIKKTEMLKASSDAKWVETEIASQYRISREYNLEALLLQVTAAELTSVNNADLEHVLHKMTLVETSKLIILDLTRVESITSVAWGVILDSGIAGYGGEIALIMEPNSFVERNFYSSNFNILAEDRSVKVFGKIDAALSFYQSNRT